MRKMLVIGGTGFVGKHLVKQLSPHYKVAATGTQYDIRNYNTIRQLVAKVVPDLVINLASLTTVRETIERPYETYDIGFTGTLNLLTVLKEEGFTGRMLQVSSSEVYGFPLPGQLPISESEPFRPMSPYSVSKVASEMLCYQWSQTEEFEVIRTRPFTHIGPGQSVRFAISKFARQIAEIIKGKREPVLHVGNIDTTRDYTDVRDVVSAYDALFQKGRNQHVYNICTSKQIRTGDLLDKLIDCSGCSIDVVQERSLMRKSEQQLVVGDNNKIRSETGWKPEVPLNTTIADIIEYWVNVVGAELN